MWKYIKHAINSTLGTANFNSLDKIARKEVFNAICASLQSTDDNTQIIQDGFEELKAGMIDEQTTTLILPPSIKTIVSVRPNVRRILIQEGVTTIKNEAFEGSHIKNILLPDSVTSIGRAAFSGSSLETINLPNGITAIPDYCFSDTFIKNFFIPSSVKSIGDYAFNYVVYNITYDGSTDEFDSIIVSTNSFESGQSITTDDGFREFL